MNLVFVLDSVNNVVCVYFGNMYVLVIFIYYVIDEDVFVCWYQNLIFDVSYRNYIIKCEGMCCFYNVVGIEYNKFIFKVNF